jgi:hypothetical protein
MYKRLSVLIVFGLLIGASDAQETDQGKKDFDQMQGTWRAIAMEGRGKVKGADEISLRRTH